jgi:hypothetical protein
MREGTLKPVQGHGPRAKRVIPIVAAVLAVAAIPIAPATAKKKNKTPVKGGATYSGLSSQGSTCASTQDQPCTVSLAVNGNGRQVTSIGMRFQAHCDNGSTFGLNIQQFQLDSPLLIGPKGKVEPGTLIVAAAEGTQPSTGLHSTRPEFSIPLDAQFSRSGKQYTVSGSFGASFTITYDDGSTTTCSSGPVTYTLPTT